MSSPLPFDAREIGQEILARIAEIDRLRSEEYREQRGPYLECRERDERRITELADSVDMLTRVADVAARTQYNDLLADGAAGQPAPDSGARDTASSADTAAADVDCA